MDWAEFRARRQKAPSTARVPLCADGEALRRLEDAQRRSQHGTPKERAEAAAQIPELREAVKAATMIVTVQALPGDEYRDLKEAHKPKTQDALRAGHEWDEDTFAPALIAASVIDPPLSLEEATELWHDRSPGAVSLAERAQLFLACRDLNETVPDLGFIEPDTGETDGIGPSSTT